jgi:hypothetical protein
MGVTTRILAGLPARAVAASELAAAASRPAFRIIAGCLEDDA